MRKTSYVVTFIAVLVALTLNVLSVTNQEWLIVTSREVLNTTITVWYGLHKRCELDVIDMPAPSGDGRIVYTDYKCREFPLRVTDECDKGNRFFCAAWTSARYVSEIGVGFVVMALVALIIGVSTHSRRRRVWRAVAGLVILQTIFQLLAFSIVTDMYRTSRYPPFDGAKFGPGYVLNTVSWIAGLFIAAGVIITGISADKGRKWAAGNRPYQPVDG